VVKVENRSTFAKVAIKHQVAYFFGTQFRLKIEQDASATDHSSCRGGPRCNP